MLKINEIFKDWRQSQSQIKMYVCFQDHFYKRLFNIYLVDEIIFCLLKSPRISWRWPAFLKMATKPRNLKPQLCGVTVTSVVTSCTFIHAQTMFFSFHPIFGISFDAFVEWYFFSTHSTPNFVSKVVSITKKVIVRYQPKEIKIDTNEFRWFTSVKHSGSLVSITYLSIGLRIMLILITLVCWLTGNWLVSRNAKWPW